MTVIATKEFTFDSAHQLVGHDGKCANLHGHTYRLEVALKDTPIISEGPKEGFVMDFGDLKRIVKEHIVDKLDHAFIAQGNEPALDQLKESGTKVVELGFRTTVENMAQFICWKLNELGVPVHYVRMWETPTGSAIVYLEDLKKTNGPVYRQTGACDLD